MSGKGMKIRILALCIAQEWKCAYCNVCLKINKPTIEHVVPLSKGGPNVFNNMLACCPQCNFTKWDAMPTAQQRQKLFEIHKTAGKIYGRLFHNEPVDYEVPQWHTKRLAKIIRRQKSRAAKKSITIIESIP